MALLSCISNATILSLKLVLSAGRNISSKKWPCDLFFNEESNTSIMIFHSQPQVEQTLDEKRIVM